MKITRISVFKNIKKYSQKVRFSIIALFLFSALSIPITIISPKFFEYLIDEVIINKKLNHFYIVVFGLLSVYLMRLISDIALLYFGNRVLNTFTYELRKDIVNKYEKTPYCVLEKLGVGDMKLRLIEDVDCLGNFIKEQVVDYIYGFAVIAATLFLSMYISVTMTFLCLLMLPVVVVINRLISAGTKKANEEIRKVNESYCSFTYNSLQFWKEIKSQNAENLFVEKFKHYRNAFAKLGLTAIRYWGYSEVFNDFKANYLTKVAVYIIGSFFAIRNEITIGQLFVFAEYFALMFSTFDNVNLKRNDLRKNTPYYNRIFESLSFSEENSFETNQDEKLNRILIKNVCFSYNKKDLTLDNINFTIANGDYIAVVGKTGCGKTTLIKLMLGLYKPDLGEIYWNNHNIQNLDKQELYKHIGVVMQDGNLFNMSIKDNLLLSNPNASENDLIKACKQANIYDYIMSLNNGFDTLIGERGMKLSGGQKQRLFIASALLKHPQIIIFDEATSSLDYQSEEIINNAISEIARELTVIVITHKPSCVFRAKKVIVMDNGRVSAIGSKSELQKTNQFFQKLVEAEQDAKRKHIYSRSL